MADKEIPAETKELVENLANYFVHGGTLKEAKGLSSTNMEVLYTLGYNLYKSGKSEDAEKVFKLITLLDYGELKYWIALGAVQQSMRKFDAAIKAYQMATLLDSSDPRSQYHAAECFLALGDKENAASALNALELFAPAESPYRAKAKKLEEVVGMEYFTEPAKQAAEEM